MNKTATEPAPFSVRLSKETERAVRKIAKVEQRSLKSVIERAVALYADGNGERTVIR